MRYVTRAGAWCDGEIAYIAWSLDTKLAECVGFMLTRIIDHTDDVEASRRVLPTWVAFIDQNNPNWNAQDASVWPIQGFEWRDLTLRKSRDTTNVRPIDFTARYEIVPVGLAQPDQTPIPPSPTAPLTDSLGQPSYEGPHHPLVQLGEPTTTNTFTVTHDYGGDKQKTKVSATFTNGILSTQNLVRQLEAVQKAPPKHVLKNLSSPDPTTRATAVKNTTGYLLSTLRSQIANPDSAIRAYLTGDVFAFVKCLLDRAKTEGGEVYLALYELHDHALIDALIDAVKNRHAYVILSSTSSQPVAADIAPPDLTPREIWDIENDPARAALHSAANVAGDERVWDRMFDNANHIGHNKFAVYVKDDNAIAVMTGSTNWTETGLCAQSNNTIIVEDDALATDYWNYWKALQHDRQPERVSLIVTPKTGHPISGAEPNKAVQGQPIRTDNAAALPERDLGQAGSATLWRSPNTNQVTVPKPTAPKKPDRPPDLTKVYDLMSHAKQAVLFLTYLPGMNGVNNVIDEAVADAQKPDGPLVLGAISDPKALPPPSDGSDPDPEYVDAQGKTHTLPRSIWWPHGQKSRVVMIRAAAVRVPVGNFVPELLSAGFAIIHDKIIVIDPFDATNCAVITGSHNLGYKASYTNDDNLLIVRGNSDLAVSYAVHVLDVYDHYVFRARLEDDLRKQLQDKVIHSFADAVNQSDPHGLLPLDGSFQDRYFQGSQPPSSREYFLAHAQETTP